MFRIPNAYKETINFSQAWDAMISFGRGDALEGMSAMQRVWEEHCTSDVRFNVRFADDSDFFDHYQYECNAYNRIYNYMSRLFGDDISKIVGA